MRENLLATALAMAFVSPAATTRAFDGGFLVGALGSVG
jgi:hypothetical protein